MKTCIIGNPKTYIAFVSAILMSLTVCSAQTGKPAVNAVSIEVGKTGLIYNLNFDHKIKARDFGFRLGAGSNLGQYLKVFSIGGGCYYLVGKTNKYLELGLDIQYLKTDEVSADQKGFASIFVYPDHSLETVYPSLNLGYRRYGLKTLFRLGLSPGIIDGELIPGGYISYGLTF